MKFFFFSIILLINNQYVLSQENYQITNNSKCKQTIYREEYIQGDPLNPGYVRISEEDIWLPCDQKNISDVNSYKNNNSQKNKNCKRTLGSLIGGGIASAISNKDAYAWAIPLGVVLGGGIGNADC